LKNRFSTAITGLKPNRTRNRLCSKIRKLRQTFISAVDEKIKKIFSPFSRKRGENKRVIKYK